MRLILASLMLFAGLAHAQVKPEQLQCTLNLRLNEGINPKRQEHKLDVALDFSEKQYQEARGTLFDAFDYVIKVQREAYAKYFVMVYLTKNSAAEFYAATSREMSSEQGLSVDTTNLKFLNLLAKHPEVYKVDQNSPDFKPMYAKILYDADKSGEYTLGDWSEFSLTCR